MQPLAWPEPMRRSDSLNGSSYADTADEIIASIPRGDRRQELTRRSDVLLGLLEQETLAAYLPVQPSEYSGRKVVRLSPSLAKAVNDLLVEVGRQPRSLRTTSQAMQAVFEAQRRFFGLPDEEDDGEHDEATS